MSELSDVVQWLESQYNHAMSVYTYSNHVRLTNGSAAMYVNIGLGDDDTFVLKGERYGETIDKQCDRDKESLLDTLSHTI